MYSSNSLFKGKSLIFFASLLFIFTHSSLNAAIITYNNGFESGDLSSLICSGNCPTVTTSSTASGKYAGDFTLTRNMPTNYRTEATLGENIFFDFGKEYWLGLDYRYEDWEKDSDPEIAPFQMHTRSSDDSKQCSIGPVYSTAPFFMRSQNDELRFITYPGKVLWRGAIQKQQWSNITVNFRISSGSDGFIEAWKDDVMLGRINGANSPILDLCGKPMKTPYFKIGVYKWSWEQTSTDSSRRQIFIDNVKIAEGSNGYSLVSSESISPSTEELTEPAIASNTEEDLLVAHWSMESGTSESIPDTSGNGYTGTLVNGAKLIPDEGIKFDGVNDYLNVGNIDIVGDEISLSAWFLANDLANCGARDCRIISKAIGLEEQDHYFMVSTIKVGSETRLRFRLKTDGLTSTLIADTGNIYENEWVHVTAVYDSEIMTLYKDGIEVGNKAKQGNISVNSETSVWIGDNPPNAGSRPWAGHIDDVRIYNFPLTSDEIVEIASAAPLSIEKPPKPSEASEIEIIEAKQYCILKADDFSNAETAPSMAISDPYLEFIKLIEKKSIRAGLGIIAKDLENPTPEFTSLIKKLNNSGRFEFWNHGYDHIYGITDEQGNFLYAEFKNRSYDYQFLQMTKAQNIVKEKLGITMRSFGAPGNKSDATTAKVIKNIGDIKVWMFNGSTPTLGVLGLPKRTQMEWKLENKRVVDFEMFKSQYNPNQKYLLSQLHPKWYSQKSLNELEKIIDFLLSRGVEFILPYDYYRYMKVSTQNLSQQ